MFLTLWNTYKFHADYAALDQFDSLTSPKGVKAPLDIWIESRLNEVIEETNEHFASWDFHKAGRCIENFVVNDLSNWYVRRSRRRLWKKLQAKINWHVNIAFTTFFQHFVDSLLNFPIHGGFNAQKSCGNLSTSR